jgi:hypothetical protein
VVQSLLEGLFNADRMLDLTARLHALLPGLEDLYERLLSSLDANYFKHACQLFRLIMARRRPFPLELYLADNEHDDSAIHEEITSLSPDHIMHRLETMQRRLVSRCKSFLEVEDWHANPDLKLSECEFDI